MPPVHVRCSHPTLGNCHGRSDIAQHPGLAINPGTPVEPYEDPLPELDMLLLMTVEPGFGGQKVLDMFR